VANAGPDLKTKEGIPVILKGAANGTDVSYYWSPPTYLSDPNILTPVANPPFDMTYTLYVTSNEGCGVSTDQVFIRVYKQVKIPNAFSPNGDGINDVWNIESLNTYPEADLQVFNRYGQLVFHSKGYSKPWDGTMNGKPLPVGTYYYEIDLKTDVYPKPSGWVFIIR
jgi:gliding motility-associated-like protein